MMTKTDRLLVKLAADPERQRRRSQQRQMAALGDTIPRLGAEASRRLRESPQGGAEQYIRDLGSAASERLQAGERVTGPLDLGERALLMGGGAGAGALAGGAAGALYALIRDRALLKLVGLGALTGGALGAGLGGAAGQLATSESVYPATQAGAEQHGWRRYSLGGHTTPYRQLY